MHAHERGDKAASPDNARSPARPAPTGMAAEILALQRTVGNAATAGLIGPGGTGVHEVLRSAGRPLAGPLRQEMETRLGADFSGVRVHTDQAAQRSAAEIGARAYTSGDHVVIGSGGADKHTVAHELTHVIQQRSGPVPGTETGDGLRMSDPSDAFERAAEANADRAMSTTPPPVAQRTTDESPATGNQGTVVQRAVGFEMEVPGASTYAFAPELKAEERTGEKRVVTPITSVEWVRRRADRPWWRPQVESPSMARRMWKKERLIVVPGLFTVEADEAYGGDSDLEFVTEPFPNDATGRDRLIRAIAGMVAIAGKLQGAFHTAGELAAGIGGATVRAPAPPAEYNTAQYVVLGFADDGHPQATPGIPLERLLALYSVMQTAHSELTRPGADSESTEFQAAYDLGAQDIRGMVSTAARQVDTVANQRAAAGQPLSDGLRGLLGLVAAYLVSGRQNPNPQYYKGIAPILARTDFAAMFGLLSQDERNRLSAANGAEFVDLALACANMNQNDLSGPVLATVAGPTAAAPRVSFDEVTRQEWLSGIPEGRDVLSQTGYAARFPQTAEKAAEFESMGSLGAQTDVAGGRPAPIVELRRMRKNLIRGDWEAVLLGVFDLITDIVTNGTPNPTYRRATTAAPQAAGASTGGQP